MRGAGLDVGVTDALVLDMPVKLGLELVAVVGPDLPDAEWEGSDHVVNEVDGVGLGVASVDLEGADTGCVVDGRELKAPDFSPPFPMNVRNLTSIWM